MIVRKIIVSTMLVIFLLALTGCSWQSANDQTKNEVFLGKKEAEFRKIGSSDKEGKNRSKSTGETKNSVQGGDTDQPAQSGTLSEYH